MNRYNLNVDYFASIDWMSYGGEWVPRKIKFSATYGSDALVVIPDPNSLKYFSAHDILRNKKLSKCPVDDIVELSKTESNVFQIPIDDMKSYLKTSFYETYLKTSESGWDVVLAAVDAAVFHYLDSCMPCEVLNWGLSTDADTALEEFKRKQFPEPSWSRSRLLDF